MLALYGARTCIIMDMPTISGKVISTRANWIHFIIKLEEINNKMNQFFRGGGNILSVSPSILKN
jgi:hypothetical protein